jgi:hypothetical protein
MQDEFSADHFIEVLEALHRDQTGLAKALEDIKRIAGSWWWATECRGSYEWDDDRYQEEFGHCLKTIVERIDGALKASSRAHELCCGRYRHLSQEDRTSVQMRLNFGYEDYADFVEEVIKVAALEL